MRLSETLRVLVICLISISIALLGCGGGAPPPPPCDPLSNPTLLSSPCVSGYGPAPTPVEHGQSERPSRDYVAQSNFRHRWNRRDTHHSERIKFHSLIDRVVERKRLEHVLR